MISRIRRFPVDMGKVDEDAFKKSFTGQVDSNNTVESLDDAMLSLAVMLLREEQKIMGGN